MDDKKLLGLLGDLIKGVTDLTSEVKALAGRSRSRTIGVSYSDKLKVDKKDAIFSVKLGRELPDDIDKKTWFEEFNNLKDASVKLVDLWENEWMEERGEKKE